MVKLGKFAPLVVILFVGLFFTTIAAGNLTERLKFPSKATRNTEMPGLRVCPDKWYKNEQPCVYQDSPTECDQQRKEYFIIDGKRKEVEEVDVEWVKENCEVNEPEVLY